MLACKLRLADKVPLMSPIRLAYSARSLNNFWDSLKSCSFSERISFSTSIIIVSDSLCSFEAWALLSSRVICNFCSLLKRSLVPANLFLAASRRYIFSSRILLMLATLLRLLFNSVAKADSWLRRITTSPSRLFFSSLDLAIASRILAKWRS